LPRRRVGISELTATVLLIAITLIAGFAVFGYVNVQAASNESQLGAAYAGNVNYLKERFVIAQMIFASGSVTVYVYNNGEAALSLASIEVYGSPRSSMDILYNSTGAFELNVAQDQLKECSETTPATYENPFITAFSDPIGSTSSVTLTLPSFPAGCPPVAFSPQSDSASGAYSVNVIGAYGNVVNSYQVYLD